VKPDAHARFSALLRTYCYHITTQKDPFLHEFTYRVYFHPDVQQMNALCEVLKEYSDFTSFSKLHTDVQTNLCRIESARWEKKGDHQYLFTITADRFLRNMVRAIVGTMLEAGRGRIDEHGLRRIIEAKNRSVAGDSAPGHALFLEDVVYPDDIWL
jgi:tRNA pseudouridine38-40 synthase